MFYREHRKFEKTGEYNNNKNLENAKKVDVANFTYFLGVTGVLKIWH